MFGVLPPVNGQPDKVQQRFVYDVRAQLAQSIDARGNATKYEYDPQGLVIRTTDALGGVVETRYNAAGQAAWTRDAMGRITTTDYDALGRPIAVHEYGVQPREAELLTITTVEPDALPLRTSEVHYDARGNVISSTDPSGAQTRFVYDDLDRRIAVAQPEVRIDIITLAVPESRSPISRTYYNIDGTVTKTVDPSGNWTKHTYDHLGRVTRTWSPDGVSTNFIYDAYGQFQRTTDRDKNGSETVFDPLANTKTVDEVRNDQPVHAPTLYQYNELGQLVRFNDARGNATEYVYDALGRKVGEMIVIGGEDLWRFFVYDAAGNLVYTRDRDGRQVRYEYDALGRRTDEWWLAKDSWLAENAPGSDVFTIDPRAVGVSVYHAHFDYFSDGHLKTAFDERRNVGAGVWTEHTQYAQTYDLLGQPDQQTANLPGLPEIVLDQNFNDRGLRSRLTTTIGGVVDNVTDYALNALGLTTLVTRTSPAAPDVQIEFVSDLQFRPARIYRRQDTGGGWEQVSLSLAYFHEFTHQLRSLTHHTSAVSRDYAYQYYATGRLHFETIDEKQRTRYDYSDSGQVIREAREEERNGQWYGRPKIIQQGYDANGNILTAQTGAYNRLLSQTTHELHSEVLNLPQVEMPGQVSSEIKAARQELYDYNAEGNLIRSLSGVIVRTAEEQRTGTGEALQVGSRVSTWRLTDSSVHPSWTLTTGNLPEGSHRFGIYVTWPEEATAAALRDGAASYAVYDGETLLFSQTVDQSQPLPGTSGQRWLQLGETLTLGAGVHTLRVELTPPEGLGVEGKHLLVDAVRLVEFTESTDYTWDHRGQLVSLTTKNAAGFVTRVVTNQYDVFGRWIGQQVDDDNDWAVDSSRHFVYDGANILLAFADADGSGPAAPQLSNRYLWGQGVDQILADQARETTGSDSAWVTYFAHPDRTGTPRDWVAQTSATEFRHTRLDYDAFGRTLSAATTRYVNGLRSYAPLPAGLSTRLIAWTGKPRDALTGLQYNNARWYSPEMQRFISEDPIGLAGGDTNLYRYGYNNPNQFSDPSGNLALVDDAIVVGALIGLNLWIWGNNAVMADDTYRGRISDESHTPYSTSYWAGAAFSTGAGAALPALAATLPAWAVTTGGLGLAGYGMYASGGSAWQAYQQGNYFETAFHVGAFGLSAYAAFHSSSTAIRSAGPALESLVARAPSSVRNFVYTQFVAANLAIRAPNTGASRVFAGLLRPPGAVLAPTQLSSASDAARQRVLANIADSQAARASSNFTQFDRRVVARQFYGDAGFSGGRLEAHLQGIDFSKPVTVQTIPQGAYVEQWVKGGKVGNYFAPLGQAPEMNGISRGMRTPIAFQANKNVKVLQSYAAPIKDTWTLGPNYPVMTPGGGVQYFAPNQNAFDIIFGW